MNLDDARTVLEWMGYEIDKHWMTQEVWQKGNESVNVSHHLAEDLDANWLMRALVPALKTKFPQKWGINVFYGWDDAVSVYFFGVGVETLKGTGSTFEAAMISAAAKAIRGTK